MEIITSLWTAAPTLKAQVAIFLMLLQMMITIWCYSLMSKARMAAAKSGKVSKAIYVAVGDAEPEELRVYTRLLANQFEMPVLFYVIMVTGLAVGITSWITVLLGLVYVLFRYLHAKEMSGAHVVMKRRKLFIRSAQVILLMMLELAVSTIFFLQV